MSGLFKIHFISFFYHGYRNNGDLFCSPLLYYYDYFSKYNIILHQIQSPKYIEISKNDVVIIGGGGILYDNWNTNIKKIQECCDNVIIWGAGTNSNDINAYSNHPVKIDYSKFKLVGVRDFINADSLNYAPCVSCMIPLISEVRSIKPTEEIGTMISFGYKPSSKYSNMDHFQNINEVFDFISKYEIIITTSYHCSYWATLCGKKVIGLSDGVVPKLINQKYAPPIIKTKEFNDAKNLKKVIESTDLHSDAYNDCIASTHSYFIKVRNIIENKSGLSFNDYSKYYEKMMLTNVERKIDALSIKISELENKLENRPAERKKRA